MTASRSSFFSLIKPAILFTIVMVLVTGLAYPLLTVGVANLLFPYQAKGSLIMVNDKVAGSELIGQNFTKPEYFHPRPSATSGTDSSGKTVPQPYNADNSSGSNSGPTKADFIKGVNDAAAAYRKENGLAANVPVPVDAVTASGSGLDPDISLANASLQVNRVAQARRIPIEQIQELIRKNTTGRELGILGEPRVNVLKLNLALDALRPG
jgi:K+-transporting ATPase ATPase C chain